MEICSLGFPSQGNQGWTINGSKLKFKWQFKGNYCGDTGNWLWLFGFGIKTLLEFNSSRREAESPILWRRESLDAPGKKFLQSSGRRSWEWAGTPWERLESFGILPPKGWSRLKPHIKKRMNSPNFSLKAFFHLLGSCSSIFDGKMQMESPPRSSSCVFNPFSLLGFGGMGLVRIVCCVWSGQDFLSSFPTPPKNFGVWGENCLG